MKTGDMIRVKDGSGCYEDGEDTTCFWPESKGQIGVVVEMTSRRVLARGAIHLSNHPAAKIMVMNEIVEFNADELEVINASR